MSDTDVDLFIRVTTTLLGITYPILLQVVARLDEKYASNVIVQLFDTEIPKLWFKNLLILSLVIIFIRSLKLKPLINSSGILGYIIENSANLLVVISSTALVVFFFLFVEKILIYYTPIKFINYLINKYHKSNDITYFTALSDIFLLAVQKQNFNISQTIIPFFRDAFYNERIISHDAPTVYPQAYYSLIYKTTEELAVQKSKKNISLERYTAGGAWLVGENDRSKISNETFYWLWRNILISLKNDQDDMILSYWQTANSFFKYGIGDIYPDYGFEDDKVKVKNAQEVEVNREEKRRFLEFNYALGGLLLYSKKYKCLMRIFDFTTSQPPEYVLLPTTMNDVFSTFVKFQDSYDNNYTWIANSYPFPELIGLKADYEIKRWICSYIVVLFLRQYSLYSYYGIDPLAFPHTPQTQSQKKELINSLEWFKFLVEKTLANQQLIEELKFDFITKEWCDSQHKLFPLDFVEKLKIKLNVDYEANAILLPLSENKINQFYSSTGRIIEDTLDSFLIINNQTVIPSDYTRYFINGNKMIQDKDAFSEIPEVDHLNFDSILATQTALYIKELVSNTFLIKKLNSYFLNPEDIFFAIDKLSLSKDHVIVSCGINIVNYIDFYKVKGLSRDAYNSIKIIEIPRGSNIDNSLFVLKVSDLPNLIYNDIDEIYIEKYSLIPVSEKYKVYASVVDLNETSDEIRGENNQGPNSVDLRKFVLLTIIQATEIRWKKDITLLQLIEYSKYVQEGMPNELIDIKGFNEYEKS